MRIKKGKQESEDEGSSTKELAPATEQAAMPQVPLPTVPESWTLGPGGEVAGHGHTMTKKVWG